MVQSRNRGKSRQSPRFNSGHAHRGDPECFWAAVTTESKEEEKFMKTKGLLFISCLAAGALIASPSFGKPAKKSAGMSQSKAKRVAPHTTQAMRNDRHNQKVISPARAARATTAEPVTVARALTRPANTAGRVTTAAHAITATIMGAAPAITMAADLTPTTATIQARRTQTGVTARPRDITRYSYYGGGYPYSGYNNYYSVTRHANVRL